MSTDDLLPDVLRTQPEDREVFPDGSGDDRWHRVAADADDARYRERCAEQAARSLDELALLVATHDESGEPVDLDHLRDILTTGWHRDYLPDGDRGWCGTGL